MKTACVFSIVTPLKLPTFRCEPLRALINELLPTFGCPMSAMVSVVGGDFVAWGIESILT